MWLCWENEEKEGFNGFWYMISTDKKANSCKRKRRRETRKLEVNGSGKDLPSAQSDSMAKKQIKVEK